MIFHCNNDYQNIPQCYVICTLPVLFYFIQVVFLGMMLSSTFWGNLSDRYGRKQVSRVQDLRFSQQCCWRLKSFHGCHSALTGKQLLMFQRLTLPSLVVTNHFRALSQKTWISLLVDILEEFYFHKSKRNLCFISHIYFKNFHFWK